MAIKQKQEEKKSRIIEYMKEEHKWENYVFLAVTLIVLLLGVLILTDVLAVKSDAPIIGGYSDIFAWILVVISGLFTLYALYPFFKPALPEFKKISWPTGKKFLGDTARVFIFIIIFVCLFLLYDSLLTQIFERLS